MTDFDIDITVTAGTTQASPKTDSLQVVAGEITDVFVMFPTGVEGTAHLQIRDGSDVGFQIVPRNREGDIIGDGSAGIVHLQPQYRMGRPNQIFFVLWNDDIDNDHTISIRLTILEKRNEGMLRSPQGPTLTTGFFDRIKNFFCGEM